MTPYLVQQCDVLNHGHLRVMFADGLSGEVKLTASKYRGVFRPLQDPAFFAQAKIVHGAVTWPNDADLAPDAMYAEIKKNGVWILE